MTRKKLESPKPRDTEPIIVIRLDSLAGRMLLDSLGRGICKRTGEVLNPAFITHQAREELDLEARSRLI